MALVALVASMRGGEAWRTAPAAPGEAWWRWSRPCGAVEPAEKHGGFGNSDEAAATAAEEGAHTVALMQRQATLEIPGYAQGGVWRTANCPESSRVFYWNIDTLESSWQFPPGALLRLHPALEQLPVGVHPPRQSEDAELRRHAREFVPTTAGAAPTTPRAQGPYERMLPHASLIRNYSAQAGAGRTGARSSTDQAPQQPMRTEDRPPPQRVWEPLSSHRRRRTVAVAPPSPGETESGTPSAVATEAPPTTSGQGSAGAESSGGSEELASSRRRRTCKGAPPPPVEPAMEAMEAAAAAAIAAAQRSSSDTTNSSQRATKTSSSSPWSVVSLGTCPFRGQVHICEGDNPSLDEETRRLAYQRYVDRIVEGDGNGGQVPGPEPVNPGSSQCVSSPRGSMG